MSIYDHIQFINDCELIVFKIFDFNAEDCVLWTDDDGNERNTWTSDELCWSQYSDYEFASMDMWIQDGKIYIEFNVDIEEDEE